MSQHQEKARIIRFEQLSEDNFRLTLQSPQIAAQAFPGQFVMILTGKGNDPLLRRPFSLHQASTNGSIQVYFKNVGRGTDILAHAKEGEILDVFGPLGRGYRLVDEKPACLLGGGLGIAPLLFLAKALAKRNRDATSDLILLGGRSKPEVEPLVDDFKQFGMKIICATDDGTYGEEGFVTESLDSERVAPGTHVYACGPEAMLETVHDICLQRGFGCQVSVESVMACGMGACLGCNIPASDGTYAHVCIDGPVFDSGALVWKS
ncbi:MAG: dihydroorotate dehydrogenase electron transfer subunit [Desulfobulbaceae bacterium]|nr:MAG: dihydroorotate dehydrogenase electron transfer subunit [Desulfobulbaceae bacterium]